MSYLYSKVVVSTRIYGDEIPDSFEEMPIAIKTSDIMAFYKRIEEPGTVGNCQQRHTTVVLRDGTEFYLPFTFAELAQILDPSGGGGLMSTTFQPTSPTVLTPSI